MATTTQLTITTDEYLRTSYRPDCDYVDGEVQQRNLGEKDHAEVQIALSHWLRSHDKEWNTRSYMELRMQVAPTRFRVADAGIFSRDEVIEQVPTRPPLVVIEILSPEDRVSRYEERIDDYRNMGVRNIWIIDPKTRRGFDCSTGSWIETQSFKIENSPIKVDLPDILAELG
jgi:Uma2 family endonuclease